MNLALFRSTALLFYILLFAIPVHAQDARAKFQEAEQLYESSKHEAALAKIDEVEAMLGSTNPRTMYLRISALYGILKSNPNADFTILEGLRRNTYHYLNNFSRENIPAEKISEISRISTEVNSSQYARTREEFNSNRDAIYSARRNQIIEEVKQKINYTNCTNEPVQTFESIKRATILHTTTFECNDNGDVTILMETHDIERKKKLLKTMRRTITFNIREIDEVFRNGSKRDNYGDYREGYIAIKSKTKSLTVRNESILNPKAWPKDFVAKNNFDETTSSGGSLFYYCNQDNVPALLMELKGLF